MNIHFSYYEIAKHHLTKMHTWFNLYYSILLAKFCQKLKEHITEKITALHGYSLSLYHNLVKIQGTVTNEISLKRQELGH